jgi:hypothetical protein
MQNTINPVINQYKNFNIINEVSPLNPKGLFNPVNQDALLPESMVDKYVDRFTKRVINNIEKEQKVIQSPDKKSIFSKILTVGALSMTGILGITLFVKYISKQVDKAVKIGKGNLAAGFLNTKK